jgi:hypothetical protein
MARALMIAAVERATKRASAQVRLEFSDGLSGLATVTSLAPWLGLLATLEAFVNAFVGCGGEKSACMAATVAGISRAIWPTALGVGIGVIALCGYRCLSATVERFDAEMQAASRDLVNTLVAYRGCWSFATVGDCAIPGGILDTNAPADRGRIYTIVTVVALLLAATIQMVWAYIWAMYPAIDSVVGGAGKTVVGFGLCYALACMLGRRSRGREAVAGVLTLIWTALEIMLHIRLP